MRDWSEDQKRKALSFSTPKRPMGNQRCMDQLWEKLDRGEKVRPEDLAHCSECVSTIRWMRKKGHIRLTLDGFLKPPLSKL